MRRWEERDAMQLTMRACLDVAGVIARWKPSALNQTGKGKAPKPKKKQPFGGVLGKPGENSSG